MTRTKSKMPDTVSDLAGARTGMGPIARRTADQVRAAQLVTASYVVDDPRAAANDPRARAEVREVLLSLGICNTRGRIDEVAGRTPIGLGSGAGSRGYRTPGRREPAGRLSRAAKRRGEIK